MTEMGSSPQEAIARIRALEAEVRRLRTLLAGASEAPDIERLAGPIFVGGTGRSGTWVIGRLLDRHPSIVTIRTELRFHASEGGLGRVLRGDETPAEFAERVATRWFDISGAGGQPKGPFLLASPKELQRATQDLVKMSEIDLRHGLEAFCRALIDPYALGRGAATWVETTPDNATAADTLLQVFPDARVIHMVRDGRDVAASVMTMPWGPSSYDDALDWWEQRMMEAHWASRRADPERLLVIRLEELIHLDRRRVFDELMALVGIDDRRAIEKYFEHRMDGSHAHVGRWRREVSEREAGRRDDLYRATWARLEEAGALTLPISPDVADNLHD